MSGYTLQLRQAPGLRVDLRGVTPAALAALTMAEIERLPLAQGNAWVALAEFFRVEARADDLLVLAGDLARFDRVGWQMNGGRLVADGPVGHYAGGAMRGGDMQVRGAAGDLAACEMVGGTLTIDGSAGDFAASTLPGSMDGMRGGTLVVRGNVGARFADRMRRGCALIHGNAGDFLASRMVAGTIALAGTAGAHPGFGMRRGSVVFAGPAPAVPATFVTAGGSVPVFWQLLARSLARYGGAFSDLPGRSITRHLGDAAALGKGEWILAQ